MKHAYLLYTGYGKTKLMLDAIVNAKEKPRVLLISTKMIVESSWQQQIDEWYPGQISYGFITGTVIVGFTQAPLKALVFAAAFALGTYLGSWLEDQIALGLSTIQIITSEDPAALIAALRANNLAVTTIDAEGREGARKILSIHLKRKRIRKTVKLINNSIPNCMITVTDVKVLKGGYIRK